MNENLKMKVEASIELLKRGERLALALDAEHGYYLAFSGGKDSQCLLELAKMAGVKFTPIYAVTGIDSPVNVKFIEKHYPQVKFVYPKENYFRLIEKKGLPLIRTRFCCERLKERLMSGTVLLDGVRWAESRKRAEYKSVAVRSRRKENIERGRYRDLAELESNEHRCIKGKDRIDMHPILPWSTDDVWEFIHERGLPINPCYSSVSRVGCMYCPFASKEQIELFEREYPLYRKRLILSLQRFLAKHPIEGILSAEDYLEFWKSKKTLKAYISSRINVV